MNFKSMLLKDTTHNLGSLVESEDVNQILDEIQFAINQGSLATLASRVKTLGDALNKVYGAHGKLRNRDASEAPDINEVKKAKNMLSKVLDKASDVGRELNKFTDFLIKIDPEINKK